MIAIYKRELRSYFRSMIGYVFIAFLVAYTGIYFLAYNLNYGYPYFSYVLSGIMFVYLVAIPILTMRCFAEDKKNRTDQMLLTAPVSLFKIVLGKYLAMVTIMAIPCLIYLIFPLIIKAQGTAYILVDYLAILVFFLLGCVYIAIGMFISSLTESVIIAAIGTFGILLLTYLWSGILNFIPSAAWANAVAVAVLLSLVVLAVWNMTRNIVISGALELIVVAGTIITYVAKKSLFESLLSTFLGKLELTEVFSNIADNHLLDVSGIILYLSLIVLFFFLTMQMIQKRRWS
nr:ABC transporter permease [uncultured Dorea sp.]